MATAVMRRRRGQPGIGVHDVSTEGRDRTALVTGASSGIGRSFAQLFGAKGYDVVVVARREDQLKELQAELEVQRGVRVHVLPCDLGEPGAGAHIRGELRERGIAVDVLVNCAGYVHPAPYIDVPWEEELRYIRVLALSTAELCRYLLPHMVEQRWGRVITVASLVAIMPGIPDQVLYSATKAFVHKLTESLAAEYEPHGVRCTSAVVGATDTDLVVASGISAWVESSLLTQLAMLRPESVVRETYRASMRGKRVVVPGAASKLWVFALTHAPARARYALTNFAASVPVEPASVGGP